MLRSPKKSISLVNAACMTLGVPATTGHVAVSIVFSTNVGMCVMHGKKMYCSAFFSW